MVKFDFIIADITRVNISVVDFCKTQNHSETDNLRRSYYQWLIDTNQEEKAAEVKMI